MAEALHDEVRAAEKARCAAMLAGDRAALDAVLDTRLQFHHATGAVDDKAAYLAKVAEGRIRYTGIVWDEEVVIALAPDAATLSGRMITDVSVDGTAKRLCNRVLTVWNRRDDIWRMVAFQSTPLAS